MALIHFEKIRKEKKISLVDIADLLGCRYQTVSDREKGKASFKFEEAIKVKKEFFPEYDLEYLFENSELENEKQ